MGHNPARHILRRSGVFVSYRIRHPRHIVYLYMRAFNLIGLASPWRTIYLMPSHENDPAALRHELCHFEQMARDGTLTFMVKYPFQIIRYGYWNATYEVEARLAETQ